VGDLSPVVAQLLETLGNVERSEELTQASSAWRAACAEKKAEWMALRQARSNGAPVLDPAWDREVLTQPTAVARTQAFASRMNALKVFDAGDVQANGFR
jgi:3D-(3,5/4)-trihydroxycyclohexane-1,2-dione acylhydrolase (decyclizing)